MIVSSCSFYKRHVFPGSLTVSLPDGLLDGDVGPLRNVGHICRDTFLDHCSDLAVVPVKFLLATTKYRSHTCLSMCRFDP